MKILKEKTEAFIIRNNELIATCKTDLKNGTIVEYAYNKCEEAINASREYNLVNAKTAKISRNKKWKVGKDYNNCNYDYLNADFASEINDKEFYI